MKRSPADRGVAHVSAQVAAAWGALDAEHRAGELTAALRGQDRAFLDAMRELHVVRNFVGSPGNILGSTDTKHGEIAELDSCSSPSGRISGEATRRQCTSLVGGWFVVVWLNA